ncbi:MAG: class I SAM-dependent methyltransferase [Planctomycetota bacterium]
MSAAGSRSSETVSCFLCGGTETRLLFQGEGFAMGLCRGCGLVRQNPRLREEVLRHEHYDGEVQERPKRSDPTLPPWLARPLESYRECVTFVERAWEAGRPRGLWIDVGASGGGLLVAAREAGWRVAGVEIGEGQARTCREVHGFDVVHGTLREARYPDGCAGVVSFRHVMEHLHRPDADLREACRILEPGGLLLIEVPNYAGQRYRLDRLRWKLRLGHNPWNSLNIPEHLFYFTPRTLRAALERLGFRIEGFRTYGRFREKEPLVRRAYNRLRDGFSLGNKMRVVARSVSGARWKRSPAKVRTARTG